MSRAEKATVELLVVKTVDDGCAAMSKRLAYLANVQGSDVIVKRGIVANRALAASQKIGSLARMLTELDVQVQIFSLGATAERSFKFFPGFRGGLSDVHGVPVHYQVDWDVPILGRMLGAAALLSSVVREHLKNPVDALLIYNTGLPETIAARALFAAAGIPVILEYEDDAASGPDGRRGWRQWFHQLGLRLIRPAVRGVLAVTPELLSQLGSKNGYILSGVLGEDLRDVQKVSGYEHGKLRYTFAGSLQSSKGVDALCRAWVEANILGAELNIVGDGPLRSTLMEAFGRSSTINFHGFVQRQELIKLFSRSHVLINPHVVTGDLGRIFPFKLIEYIGAGRPVISTPMATLPRQLASGVLYSNSDSSADLSRALVLMHQDYTGWLAGAEISRNIAWETYGPEAVRFSLLSVLDRAMTKGFPTQQDQSS